jgi:hypothetical protein
MTRSQYKKGAHQMKQNLSSTVLKTTARMARTVLWMTTLLAIAACGKSSQQSQDGASTQQIQGSTCNATENDICGPFSQELIALCKKNGGGNACDTNRWNKVFYGQLKAEIGVGSASNATSMRGVDAQIGDDFGERFLSYYRTNYSSIYDEVGFTRDACGYFVSAALSRSGVSVSPKEGWAQNVSGELRDLGWRKITDHQNLLPGDVVFTYDEETMDQNSQYYGVSPHVFVFGGYGNDRDEGLAIDNQGNGYMRNLGEGYKSPFWYAYRKK